MKHFIEVVLTPFLLFLWVDIAGAQTTLINGDDQSGTLLANTTNSYIFAANAGDNINLRLGSPGFAGNLQLYGPNGALVAIAGDNHTDQLIAYSAKTNGTFTVLVSAFYSGYGGAYVLNLAQIPEAFIVPAGDEGGSLVNGANTTGAITLGDQDLWTFPANKGDRINVRLGSTGFAGNLKLYGPTGALLATAGDNHTDQIISYTTTTNGTFTVLASSFYLEQTGTYVLNLAQIPEPFIVPAGDGGGLLTNGANATGTITLGRQDLWTFSANKGDNINLRLGSSGFAGSLELYGPNGAQVGSASDNSTDQLITYTATTNGIFTVLVSSFYQQQTGTYVLNLAQLPEPFVVSAGDQGGDMTGGSNYTGAISLGDQDLWAFTACTGDAIDLTLNTTNFSGNIELYGPNGALLKPTTINSTTVSISYTATNCGTFTVLVSAYFIGGTGAYGLTVNGLVYELKECPPRISGTNFTFNEVGGNTNANATFVLYSTTNIATPFGLWTPVLTNQFDQFGVFDYTNGYNPAMGFQFFRFVLPP